MVLLVVLNAEMALPLLLNVFCEIVALFVGDAGSVELKLMPAELLFSKELLVIRTLLTAPPAVNWSR